jgi:glutaredoxin 3
MVTVYTTDSCAYCPMVKKYLTLKNVEFETVDVSNNLEKRQELFEKTGMMSVPVTTDGEKFVVGFNPGKLVQFTV